MPVIDFRENQFGHVFLVTSTPQQIYLPKHDVTFVHLNRATDMIAAAAADDDVVIMADGETLALTRTAGKKLIIIPGTAVVIRGVDVIKANSGDADGIRSVSLKALDADTWVQIVKGIYWPLIR